MLSLDECDRKVNLAHDEDEQIYPEQLTTRVFGITLASPSTSA
jgi:hypothetical protein